MILKRVSYMAAATCGVLLTDSMVPFAVTLENPWLANQSNVSCIPAGMYTCRRVDSPKFGDTFEVVDVPGRSHILFHKGNTEHDTEGCILVAEEFGLLSGSAAVLDSSHGFNEFMGKCEGEQEFLLTVV